MNLQLFREAALKGELFNEGQFFCYTLERSGVQIPASIYKLEIRFSPHFQKDLPHLLDVPGRTDILIHGGNEPKDSDGCILVGYKEWGPETIGDASAVLDLTRLIKAAISNKEGAQIAVIDP